MESITNINELNGKTIISAKYIDYGDCVILTLTDFCVGHCPRLDDLEFIFKKVAPHATAY